MTRVRWKQYIAPVVLGVLASAWGQWQYHRGFNRGADAAICAFAVGMEGRSAVTRYDACKSGNGVTYVIDGFDPHGKTAAISEATHDRG